jgi:hypothetical protein
MNMSEHDHHNHHHHHHHHHQSDLSGAEANSSAILKQTPTGGHNHADMDSSSGGMMVSFFLLDLFPD